MTASFSHYQIINSLRVLLCTHDLWCDYCFHPPPYIISPSLGYMCFGDKATVSLCFQCLRRLPKLLTAPAMYSHLTVLESHAAAYANSAAFKLPHVSTLGGSPSVVEAWVPVNYRRFRDDVEHFARYWITTFQRAGIAPRSCIGIWWVFIDYLPRLSCHGMDDAFFLFIHPRNF
jgi:hypothetical protein